MPRASKTCPICNKTTAEKFEPFCSKRCSDVDLGNWLGERYAIPGTQAAETDPEAEEN